MSEKIAPLTVTQLNRQIRSWLETEVGEINVTGELSNLSRPASGHLYFTLKDSAAQIRCVFFRNQHKPSARTLKDGQQVIARGRLSLYEARGDYQLIVQSLEEAGSGDLYRQFELLKAKLQALGLFDASRKKTIPYMPMTIGVITSSSGAALRDILTTLKRRFPLARVRVYPSEVQGKEAPGQLIKALQTANAEAIAEVLLLARGGGSIEDLWAFNDEKLAMEIANSPIPIVSGVGHETDFTIADFVADLRAATPTAAAEAVTVNQLELRAWLESIEERMIRAVNRFYQHQQLLLSHQIARLSSPQQLIASYWQRVDYRERQLINAMHRLIQQQQGKLQKLGTVLSNQNPLTLLQKSKMQHQILEQRLKQAIQAIVNHLKQGFHNKMATLHAVSPLATLDRGYAIASYKNTILYSAEQVNPHDKIEVQLARGRLTCEVIEN